MTSQDTADRLGRRLCHILENYDEQDLRDLFDKNVVLWHNFTGREIKGEDVFSFTTATFPAFKSVKYSDIRCTPTAGGWVQQHLVSSESDAGPIATDVAACMVVTASDGRIQRIEEYVDMSRISQPSPVSAMAGG